MDRTKIQNTASIIDKLWYLKKLLSLLCKYINKLVFLTNYPGSFFLHSECLHTTIGARFLCLQENLQQSHNTVHKKLCGATQAVEITGKYMYVNASRVYNDIQGSLRTPQVLL